MNNLLTRRHFLKTILSTAAIVGAPTSALPHALNLGPPLRSAPTDTDSHVKDYLHKMHDFDAPHRSDVILPPNQLPLLNATVGRLKRLQRLVGYGNYNLMGFDEALLYARNYQRVGRFPKAEMAFLDWIFHHNGAALGFMDEKPLRDITTRIDKRQVVKIPHTGHYLYRGRPLSVYQKIRQEIGPDAILSSGIRGIMKQFLLFLNKAANHEGNLSLASRSLAPPGYSFHGVCDFDIGQRRFGVDNFTDRFTQTMVFQRLREMAFISLRYPAENMLGVRFEPWHIKVYAAAV